MAAVLEHLIQKEHLEASVELVGSFCMAECSTGISVKVGDLQYKQLCLEQASDFFYREILPRAGKERADPWSRTG